MKVLISNICILFFVILRNLCHGYMLCSQCHLKSNPKCEEDPPNPRPCFDAGDAIPMACSVIRTYYEGEQIDFRRSCSSAQKSGCFEDPTNGHRMCSEICTTDSCNAGKGSAGGGLTSSPSLVLLSLLLTGPLFVFTLLH